MITDLLLPCNINNKINKFINMRYRVTYLRYRVI